MTYVLAALAILAVAYLLRRKRKPPASGWQFDRWTQGVTLRTVNGLPAFDFPTQGRGVGYLQCRKPPKLGGAITVRFLVEGGPFVAQEFPDRQATVTLVIQRKGDDWQATEATRAHRWYSRQVVDLVAGEHMLTVPLDVSHWGDVMGGQDAAAFAAALRDVDNIALAFGSAGGRGHGVCGAGRFELLSIK